MLTFFFLTAKNYMNTNHDETSTILAQVSFLSLDLVNEIEIHKMFLLLDWTLQKYLLNISYMPTLKSSVTLTQKINSGELKINYLKLLWKCIS